MNKVMLLLLFLLLASFGWAEEMDQSESDPNILFLKGLQYWFGNSEDPESSDPLSAYAFFFAAAQRGHASAQTMLGHMFRRGDGVPQDFDQAVYWYRSSAEQGNIHAQAQLGWAYAEGKGVIQDNVIAHMWFNIAASQGSEIARENRDLTTSEMTAEQVGEAQKLARECVQKNFQNC